MKARLIIVFFLFLSGKLFGQKDYDTALNVNSGVDFTSFSIKFSTDNSVCEEAYTYYLSKSYDKAISLANEIKLKDSSLFCPYYILGSCYLELEQYSNANYNFRKAIDHAKSRKSISSLYYYYAFTFQKMMLYRYALDNYKLTLKLDSSYYDAYSGAAKSYMYLSKFDSASYYYELRISAGKATSNDYYQLGKAYYNNQQWEKADKSFGFVTKANPDFVQGWYWQALTNINMDYDYKEGKAKPYFETLITVAKKDTVRYQKEVLAACEYLGYFYYLKKDMNTSKYYWQKVYDMDRENKRAKYYLSEFRIEYGIH